MKEDEWEIEKAKTKHWQIDITHGVVDSRAYSEMQYAPAIKVLIWFCAKLRWRIDKKKQGISRRIYLNKDNLSFTYLEAERRGLTQKQFARALKELHHFGFIDVMRHGTGVEKDFSVFSLSDRWRRYGTEDFIQKEMPVSSPRGFRKAKITKTKCPMCIHRSDIGNDGWSACKHPEVVRMEEQYPERKPGAIAAKALNIMAKALDLGIRPSAMRLKWFNWPYCFSSMYIDACKGYEKRQRPKCAVDNG